MAREYDVAIVGIRNATHLGRIGEWAERAADAGLLFAAFVNTGGTDHLVAPPGSADRQYSTNPLAFGAPTFGATPYPIVLDIATSQVAHGKVTKRAVEGKPLPEGWVTDEEGNFVTDSQAYEDGVGALLPLGGLTSGHKGFGLAMIAEVFAGYVGDYTVSGDDVRENVNNGALFMLANPDRFATRAANRARIETLRDMIQNTNYSESVGTGPIAKGDRAVLPGKLEHELRRERIDEGIPFEQATLDLLADVARRTGVEAAIPASFEA
ncbi:Ldh family oxidoreductase [Haladaptatus sp. GCM10025893]|uniref:Ldh family oxidoreductase n=1 Tax=Haladaptatus sp. GCM10025893 TaxID=3252659 RepID=UPI0036206E56